MTTLAEIEAAADKLSDVDRAALMAHLESALNRSPPPPTAEALEQWMRQLDALRESMTVRHPPSISTEQIIDEGREDRL